MNNFIKHLKLILQLVDQAVKFAETTTASGEQKRKATIAMVLNLAKAFGIDLTGYEELIGKMVDAVVFMYNMLGYFEHHSKVK